MKIVLCATALAVVVGGCGSSHPQQISLAQAHHVASCEADHELGLVLGYVHRKDFGPSRQEATFERWVRRHPGADAARSTAMFIRVADPGLVVKDVQYCVNARFSSDPLVGDR